MLKAEGLVQAEGRGPPLPLPPAPAALPQLPAPLSPYLPTLIPCSQPLPL